MAYNKSLELARIKPKSTYLGNYVQAGDKWFRDFKPGDFLYSRDGFTKYLVNPDGSLKLIS